MRMLGPFTIEALILATNMTAIWLALPTTNDPQAGCWLRLYASAIVAGSGALLLINLYLWLRL
jgi:hypothetical protein